MATARSAMGRSHQPAPGPARREGEDVDMDQQSDFEQRSPATKQQNKPDADNEKPKKVRKPTAPRPKLTVELLEGPKGFDDVFSKFPDTFQAGFKGKGHEISDLQRLLEMYARWQQRVYPHKSFDDFIVSLEKLSGTFTIKHKMRQRRTDLLGLVMSAEEEADEQPDERGAAAPAAGDGKEGKTNGRASTAAAPARQVQGRSRGAIADWGEDDEDAGGDGEDVVPPGRRHGAAAGGGSGPVRSSPAAPVEGRRGGGGPMEADEDDESAQYEELLAMQEASQGSAERRRQAEEDAALEAVGPDWGWEDEEGVPAPAAPAPARPAAAGSQQGGGHAAAAVGRAAPGGRLSRRSQQSAFVGSDDAMQEDGLEDGMEDGMEGAGTGAAAAAAGAGRGSGSLEDATMPSAAEKSDSDRDVDEELVARLLDDADDAGGAEEDQEVEVKAGVRGRTALPSQAPRGASQGGAGRARQVLMDDDDD